ncbi:hypothetical protein Cgig2_013038 [Carnegiea gigantea]|uniref:Uncharacterized protein n=1 Tax=Carnegiea gigantea TaxID=171969 RepID=A0A9Q1KR06_9CARY|nr:hypothetical protein Cgig2_013038 [Carnegiea gigantea]
MKKNVAIPLYIIEIPEASSLQKVVQSLDRLNKAKQRGQEQGSTQNQPDISIDKYQSINLFRDVRSSAMENGVKLPKFPRFRWHPPGRENQSLANHWGKIKKIIVIPLYIIEIPEASSLQKVVQSLDSKAGAWIDNLIVTHSTEKVIPSENSSKCQPKVTANRPNKLPIRRPRPRAAKQPITLLQIDQASHYTSTKSKSKYLLKSTPSPISTPTAKSPSPASPSKKVASQPVESPTSQTAYALSSPRRHVTRSQIAQENQPGEDFDLEIVRVDLEGLHDFDVHSLCQPQIGVFDVFDSDVEENLGQADDEDSNHDDSKDSDFREWQLGGSEESDSLSLDEDNDLEAENESLDDIDLENDTQLRSHE